MRLVDVARVLAAVVALSIAVPFVAGFAAAPAGPEGRVELTFSDPAIVESSGLVARDGLVVTVNDSGDSGRVFTVDRRTGDTVGVTTWTDEPDDVEALAFVGDGSGEVWVADVGDNLEARDSVTVARVPVGRGDRDLRDAGVPSYELVYPDGPHDAETLLVAPDGRLVIVTKGVFGGDVLAAPARLDPDRPNRMRPLGEARAIATDGAFWPDGRHLVVRGYSTAVVYTWPGLDVVDTVDLPEQQQGEGIAVDEDGVVLVSSEGAGSQVLRVRLPRRVAAAVAPLPEVTPTPTPSPAPSPASPDQPDVEPADRATERSAWPYVVGLAFGAVMLVLLVRSLRPRG